MSIKRREALETDTSCSSSLPTFHRFLSSVFFLKLLQKIYQQSYFVAILRKHYKQLWKKLQEITKPWMVSVCRLGSTVMNYLIWYRYEYFFFVDEWLVCWFIFISHTLAYLVKINWGFLEFKLIYIVLKSCTRKFFWCDSINLKLNGLEKNYGKISKGFKIIKQLKDRSQVTSIIKCDLYNTKPLYSLNEVSDSFWPP